MDDIAHLKEVVLRVAKAWVAMCDKVKELEAGIDKREQIIVELAEFRALRMDIDFEKLAKFLFDEFDMDEVEAFNTNPHGEWEQATPDNQKRWKLSAARLLRFLVRETANTEVADGE